MTRITITHSKTHQEIDQTYALGRADRDRKRRGRDREAINGREATGESGERKRQTVKN